MSYFGVSVVHKKEGKFLIDASYRTEPITFVYFS